MNDKLQNLYRINLLAAFVVGGIILLYFALYSLSLVQADSRSALLATFIILALFLPINLYLKAKNRNHQLRIPNYIQPNVLKALTILAAILCAIVLAYGFQVYPHAPIQPDGEFFIDKSGAMYSYAEFRTFQKWEVGYLTSWNILALLIVVSLPFYDRTTKKWRL